MLEQKKLLKQVSIVEGLGLLKEKKQEVQQKNVCIKLKCQKKK
jgi:hypothetical protein